MREFKLFMIQNSECKPWLIEVSKWPPFGEREIVETHRFATKEEALEFKRVKTQAFLWAGFFEYTVSAPKFVPEVVG